MIIYIIITIIILGIVSAGLLFLLLKQIQLAKTSKQELKDYTERYKDIIDVDKTLVAKNDEVKSINQSLETLKANFNSQKEQLNQDYTSKRYIYENLLKEISIVEENLEDISYGLYKPHYDYNTSEEYKRKLEE